MMNATYTTDEPARTQLDAMSGPAVIEFGAPWCGYCRAAQPLIAGAFASHESVPHFKIEDGSGRPLGRSFGVKLWPTLVFLKDGKEQARLVRPTAMDDIRRALDGIAA